MEDYFFEEDSSIENEKIDPVFCRVIESGDSIMIQRYLQKRIPNRKEINYGIDSKSTPVIIKDILKGYLKLLDSGFPIL